MSGGDVTVRSGGRFSLGGKVWRAPTPQHLAREERERALRELEARKVKDIKHETRHLAQTRRLEQKAVRANNHALGVELGTRGGLYRSRSLGQLGGGGLGRGLGLGGMPLGGGLGRGGMGMGMGMGGLGGGMALERERIERERTQLELQRVRDQRRRIEEEAMRRQRTASMIRSERAQLAGMNSALLASPRSPMLGVMGSPRMGGSPLLGGSPYLGAGLGGGLGAGAGGLRRVRSFSSAPLGTMGHHHGMRLPSPHASPRIMPIPVPMPMQQGRPGNVTYNTYNVSPHGHSPHLHSHHGSPLIGGGLGAFDDLGAGGYSAGIIDPPLFGGGGSFGNGGAMFPPSPRMGMMGGHSPRMAHSPRMGGMGMMGGHSPRMGAIPGGFAGEDMGMMGGMGGMNGMGMGGMGMGVGGEQEFIIEEGSMPMGRMIQHRIGPVVGRSAAAGLFGGEDDSELVDMAIADMTRNAQMQGANGVVAFRIENDESGAPIALGEAVVIR